MALRRFAEHQPAQLLERHLTPRGLTAGFGGRIGLTDAIMHHQNIRRPLGRERTIPPERLIGALDFALTAPTLPSRRPLRDLQLTAADLPWTHGTGPRLKGPAEALLMTIAGRTSAHSELSGPGRTVLDGRMTAS